MKQHLGLFAKYWEPGKVKTRLNPLDSTLTSKIYFQFLLHQIAEFKDVGDHRTIVFAPLSRKSEFESISNGWSLVAQSEGDLGRRMSGYFMQTLGPEESHVIVIGSDTPHLSPTAIEEAFDRLHTHDAVIGPSTDGGYYLIGLSHFFPQLFEGIHWSTAQVLQETLDRIHSAGASLALLPTMTDIDEPRDLKWLFDELERTKTEPGSQRLMNRLQFASQLGKGNG